MYLNIPEIPNTNKFRIKKTKTKTGLTKDYFKLVYCVVKGKM